ncbi:hypothetical protein B9Z55_008930 [Caenorhabditis nigoni]|uniref:Uncharacterized protein n=1 Tax=Caenorhabditis nigoni TaxID=1611254 RepID=A0A2G5UPX0_9PELO|nr:hypothetical protein B9Z55_008930 [Caenorhabditis nigoni]
MPKRNFKPIYSHNGFAMRHVNYQSNGSEWLHCTERKSIINCLATARRTNGVITMVSEHSGHDPDDGIVAAKILRKEIKESAETTDMTPRDLIHKARVDHGVRATVIAGSTSSLVRMVHRARDEKCVDTDAVDAPVPVFQGKMLLDDEKQQFLLFDEHCPANNRRHVAFGSRLGLEVLEKSDTILTDGTFSVAQPPFGQLWSIHAEFGDSTVPVVHVLMSSRQIVDYTFVLNKLKLIAPRWNPSDYLGDLEIGQARAISDAFSNIRQNFCYFHLIQSWYRKIKTLKIDDLTVHGKSLYEFWSLLKCLPFGDPNKAETDFNEILSKAPQPLSAEMQEFEKYMRGFYIGPRRNLKFPPEKWNVQDRTLRGIPRTTNAVESLHRNLEHCVRDTRGRSTPLLSELLRCLRQEASVTGQ